MNSRSFYEAFNTKDFYKGTSFRYNYEWSPGTHYFHDEYIIDFVSHNGIMYVCKETVESYSSPNIDTAHWAYIMEGQKGDKGEMGTIFVPTVDGNGNISWSNDAGLPNPETMNIKGNKGDTGERGEQGIEGKQGLRGFTGLQGPTGPRGVGLQYIWDGTLLGVKRDNDSDYVYVDLRGPQGIRGLQGSKGNTGQRGEKGDTGERGPAIMLRNITDSSDNITIQSSYDGLIWNDLVSLEELRGEPGHQVQLRQGTTSIEWKYSNETVWNSLVSYNNIMGPKGDSIDRAYIADDGYLYIWLSSEFTPRRVGYVRGDKGEDGRSILLRGADGHIQWKYAGDDYKLWSNLVSYAELSADLVVDFELRYERREEGGVTYDVFQIWSEVPVELITETKVPITSTLENVEYDVDTSDLIFTFNTSTGTETTRVNIPASGNVNLVNGNITEIAESTEGTMVNVLFNTDTFTSDNQQLNLKTIDGGVF